MNNTFKTHRRNLRVIFILKPFFFKKLNEFYKGITVMKVKEKTSIFLEKSIKEFDWEID